MQNLLEQTRILFFFLFTFQAFGQENLILNGDFEEYWECPDDETEIFKCKHVYNPCYHDPPAWSSTSDYFNACSSTIVSVPFNFPGFQNARSGSGYLGFIIWESSNNNYYNEYIQLEFSEVLIPGATYKLKIFANLGDIMEYSTKNIQFKFVDSYMTYSIFLNQIFEPDFRNDSLITDTLNWVPIEFEFIAKGGEKYVIIGNFDESNSTDFNFLYDLPSIDNPNYVYFYLDDASLVLTKEPSPITFPNIITPNKDGLNEIWYPISNCFFGWTCEILNRWGNRVYKFSDFDVGWNGLDQDGNELPEGVYYYRISNDKEIKSGFIELMR